MRENAGTVRFRSSSHTIAAVASRFSRGDDEDDAAMPELIAFLSYASLEAGKLSFKKLAATSAVLGDGQDSS